MTRFLGRAATVLVLALPLVLLHGRALAEAGFVLLDVLFLVHAATARDWSWTRSAWVRIAACWWLWVVLCSVPHGAGPALQAVGAGRFLLAAAALEHWALRDGTTRRWLLRLLQWSALYLAAQSLLQFATGRNLFGYPRGADGELTGPYKNPRAGAPLSRLLYPAVLPAIDAWLSRGRVVRAALLLPASIGLMVLIGQRMPLLLSLFGLFVTALFLPRLRQMVLVAGLVTGMVLTLTPVISPPTYHRLVTKFSDQMEHFGASHYGLIAVRAVVIARAQPVLGAGFDGFRRECENPAYFRGLHGSPAGDGGGAAMCVQHPHNVYLQALVEGGVPGLLLFAALVLAWLTALLRGLWHDPDPLRVGLFVAALLHLWPVASTTAFTSMPLGGWFFLLLGLGLAQSRYYISSVPSEGLARHG